jgi:hypothetical protein
MSDAQTGTKSFGYDIIFKSGPITSLRQGLGYQGLQFAFDDGVSQGDEFNVNINVVSLNEPPAFLINNVSTTDSSTEMDANINKGSPFRPSLAVTDKDISNGDITITVDISPQDGSKFDIDVTSLGAGLVGRASAAVGSSGNVLTYDAQKGISFKGKIDQVNEALRTFTFYPKDDSLGKKYTVTFVVNDNGYTGQCGDAASPTLKWDGVPCPLESKLIFSVTSVDKMLINGSAIAAGGLAAIGLTALVAIAAMRLLNKKAAEDGYAPWNNFDADGGVLDNPLYEKGGIEATSPIYDSSNKQYVEMSSVSSKDQAWL